MVIKSECLDGNNWTSKIILTDISAGIFNILDSFYILGSHILKCLIFISHKMTLNGCQNWHKMTKIHKKLIFQMTDKDDSHDKNVIQPDFKNLKQVWE